MEGRLCILFLALFCVQGLHGQQQLTTENSQSSIQSWVNGKQSAIVEVHKPLMQKIGQLTLKLDQMGKSTFNDMVSNMGGMPQALCLQGIQMNAAAGMQGMQCLASLAAQGVTKQIETQMNCFATMKKYTEQMAQLGQQMAACAGNSDCVQAVTNAATVAENENRDLVNQKLTHVTELENSLEKGRTDCMANILAAAAKSKEVCASSGFFGLGF